MINLFIANAIVLLHGLFILFAIFGGFLAWRWRKIIFLHIPALCWGIWIELSHGICPLTPLENTYRHLAGEAGYEHGFIEHYLLPIIYPTNLTADLQYIFAAVLTTINILAYGLLIKRYRLITLSSAIN
jgi:hypothetical protein